MSCASKSTTPSKKNKTATNNGQRSRSLLAERTVPGHVSMTMRKRLDQPTVLKGASNKTWDKPARQH